MRDPAHSRSGLVTPHDALPEHVLWVVAWRGRRWAREGRALTLIAAEMETLAGAIDRVLLHLRVARRALPVPADDGPWLDDAALEAVLGPAWSEMTPAERAAYGPRIGPDQRRELVAATASRSASWRGGFGRRFGSAFGRHP